MGDPYTILDSFLKKEQRYVTDLATLLFTFRHRLAAKDKLEKPIITDEDMNVVFSNIADIYAFNRSFYQDMMELRLKGPRIFLNGIGKLMSQNIPVFKMYKVYLINKQNSQKRLAELFNTNQRFQDFVTEGNKVLELVHAGDQKAAIMKNPKNPPKVKKCKKLKQLLQLPIRHYVIYLVELTRVLGAVSPEDEDKMYYYELQKAIFDFEKMVSAIAQKIVDDKEREDVVNITTTVWGNKMNLINPSRRCLVHNNAVKSVKKGMLSGPKEFYFALFNDVLIYGSNSGMIASGTPKGGVPVLDLKISLQPKTKDFPCDFQILLVSPYCKEPLCISFESDKLLQRWKRYLEVACDNQKYALKRTNPHSIFERLSGKVVKDGKGQADNIDVIDQKTKDMIATHVEEEKAKQIKPPALPQNVEYGMPTTDYENLSIDVGGEVNAADYSSEPASSGFTGGSSQQQSAAVETAWQECTDEQGYIYYWNQETGETQWERPETMGPEPYDVEEEPEPEPEPVVEQKAESRRKPPPGRNQGGRAPVPGGGAPIPGGGAPVPAAVPSAVPEAAVSGPSKQGGPVNMLADIRGFNKKKLGKKKKHSSKPPPKKSGGSGGFLADIRAGPKLKHRKSSKAKKPRKQEGDQFMNAMQNRIAHLRDVMKPADEEDSDSDWDE